MELWKVYDQSGAEIGVCEKGKLPEGALHRVAHLWTIDEGGRFLLSRRAYSKHHGGLWETTGGSVQAGETPEEAAAREAAEELGQHPEELRLFREFFLGREIVTVFYARYTGEPIVLRAGETMDSAFLTKEELRAMHARGECMPFTYEEELFAFLFGDSTFG